MSDNLISKKEILQLTGISYGQLYRWKRKKLIPEDWFIKKSSFTGQETFFPKDKILARIDKILNMKDDLSLDEIAKVFEPNLAEVYMRDEELKSRNIVNEMTIHIYKNLHEDESVYSLEKILFMYIVEKFIKTGEVGIDEGKLILKELERSYNNLKKKNFEIVLLRKFGVPFCFIVGADSEYYIEEGAKLVYKSNIQKCLEELNLKLGKNMGIAREV